MSPLLTKAATSLHLLLAHHSPWVLVGAFSGSVIFVISINEFTLWARLALFSASMIIGTISSDCTASVLSTLLSRYLDITVNIPPAIGATVTAVTAVRLLMGFNKKISGKMVNTNEKERSNNENR
ncbi:putative holin [unidentified bacterial endosymbiont]|jgi:Putative phage holin|uniref:putative holin n=1 Tax=unidentified bacterial endosymbiont TaxID=2355 RepID=UPI0020A1EC3F|nr:putative holin [unidentified bacterial endosymbiont]